MKTVGNPQAQAPEESVNPQATKKTFVGEAGKTEVVFTDEQRQAVQIRIFNLIQNDKQPAEILNLLRELPDCKSLPFPDLQKLVQTVVATMTKSPDLSDANKASAGKLLDFVEKKIENEKSEASRGVPTIGNQNPGVAQTGPTAGNQNPGAGQTSSNGAGYVDKLGQARAAAEAIKTEGVKAER